MNKVIKAIKDPHYACGVIFYRLISPFVKDDETYIKWDYYFSTRKKLNLENPRTLNEKLEWLKLNNKNPFHSVLVDKYEVRDYIKKTLGDQYLIPLLGCWNSFEEIDFDKLPNQFVIKCSHDSGSTIVCRDKKSFNFLAARKKINKCLKRDFYKVKREYPYKGLKRRIIAEQYVIDSREEEGLTDYKFYCFRGKVPCVLVCLDRHLGDPKFYFFNEDWELQRFNKRGKDAPEGFTIPKPKNMEKMFEIAKQLSKNEPFVRVDMYNVDGKIYFGELTFFPDGGADPNRLPEADQMFGDMVEIHV